MDTLKFKKIFLAMVVVSSCSDEQEETRCYTPGSLRQVTSIDEKFPELPCISKDQAKSLLDRGCERLEVEEGPTEKNDSGNKQCCYDFKVTKISNCTR